MIFSFVFLTLFLKRNILENESLRWFCSLHIFLTLYLEREKRERKESIIYINFNILVVGQKQKQLWSHQPAVYFNGVLSYILLSELDPLVWETLIQLWQSSCNWEWEREREKRMNKHIILHLSSFPKPYTAFSGGYFFIFYFLFYFLFFLL